VSDRVALLGVAVSLLLFVIVLELVRRRRLTEEYSFVWIVFALMLVALSLRRQILYVVARWLGIYYPPIVLLLVLILMVFVTSLSFAVIVSRLRRQIERLVEDTAVLGAELHELRSARSSNVESEAERERTGSAP